MLTHFVDIIVFAPFVLPRGNWSFDSGKTNGVMPAHDVRKSLASLAISVHRAPGLTPLDVLRFARSARDFAHLQGWRLRLRSV